MNDNSADNKEKAPKPGSQKNIAIVIVAVIAAILLVTMMQRGGICCPGVATGGADGTHANVAVTASGTTAGIPVATETEKRLPLMLNFGAKQCAPCKMMAPILDGLKKDFQDIMDIVYIDVWKKENTAKAREHNIQSIPTQILYDEHGKELWRHTGFISREDILGKWRALGYDMEKMLRTTDGE